MTSRERPDAHACWLPALAALPGDRSAGGRRAVRTRSRKAPVAPAPQRAASGAGAGSRRRLPIPIAALIARRPSDHFDAGERELKLGHLERARVEFDRAVDVLLESPVRRPDRAADARAFDRLVDRISAYEVTALAQGDGFAETKYRAGLDRRAARRSRTFPRPDADAATDGGRQGGPRRDRARHPDSAEREVLAYVELFQGRLRDYIQEGLTRGAKYLPMIQNVFRAEGLPLDLAYMPLIESAFKTNALSKASAKGAWQFMKPTARGNGLKHDWYIDERSDPEKATVAAAKYLKTLCRMFDGDWHLALASYNGGPGRVQRAMKRSGTDDFWSLAESPRLPAARNPRVRADDPGGDHHREESRAVRLRARAGRRRSPTRRCTVPRAVDLRRVAEWTGTPVDEIQALNPELRRWTTPVQVSGLRAEGARSAPPTGSRRGSPSAPASDLGALNWYTVKSGETLATIARKLRVSRARSGRGELPVGAVARPPRPEADHSARARRRCWRRAPIGRRRRDRRVARHCRAGSRVVAGRRRRRRAARTVRSPTASSAATRSPRSRGCSTPPSPSIKSWNRLRTQPHLPPASA